MGEDQLNDLYQELDDQEDSRDRPGPDRHTLWNELLALPPRLRRDTLLVLVRRNHHLSVAPVLPTPGFLLSGEIPSTHRLVMQPARRPRQSTPFVLSQRVGGASRGG